MKDYRLLLNFARECVKDKLENKKIRVPKEIIEFQEKRGVFVTINKDGKLRGCIGYILPVYPLWEAVLKAALAAGFEDPRFQALKREELNRLNFEISILSKPEKISDKLDMLSSIEIGKHGLIIKKNNYDGLLLPQVAVEYNWSAIEFLERTCEKAGLAPGAWKSAEVYRFSADVYSE